MKYRNIRITMLIVFLVTTAFHNRIDSTVTVQIVNLRSNDGAVLIAVYNNGKNFPRDAARYAVGKEKVAIANKTARVTFNNLGPGRYAVAILHDENNNLKMDYNMLGMPREGYGFSNDAKGILGPPGFKKAAFELESGEKTITIRMTYF